jgi:hypothetical protein
MITLPFVDFFIVRRPISGMICLVLQVTPSQWLPGAILAVYALSQCGTDKKIEITVDARRSN